MKTLHFDVRPRYTGGSPGQVSEEQALHVVEQERSAIQGALSGVYGPETQATAGRQGLGPLRANDGRIRGIAEEVTEHAGHFSVTCLATGVRWAGAGLNGPLS